MRTLLSAVLCGHASAPRLARAVKGVAVLLQGGASTLEIMTM